jgi:hypothetical protein
MCCDEDESTTNHGSILMCDTRKSLPVRDKHIPDATVLIGTVSDLRQASCEDGKGNFRNCSMMMFTGNAVSQPISPGFGQWNIRIASPWSESYNTDPAVSIGRAVVELLQFLQQTRQHDEIVCTWWLQELLYLHQYWSDFDDPMLGSHLLK